MGLKSRIKRRIRSSYKPAIDAVSKAGKGISGFAKRFGQKTTEKYKVYKDPLIIGAGTVIGGILGSVVPGVGTLAGAAVGGSLASGAVGARRAQQQQAAVKDEEKAWEAQYGGLEAGDRNSLAMQIRRRRLQRGAGEAVGSYMSDYAPAGADTSEVA